MHHMCVENMNGISKRADGHVEHTSLRTYVWTSVRACEDACELSCGHGFVRASARGNVQNAKIQEHMS